LEVFMAKRRRPKIHSPNPRPRHSATRSGSTAINRYVRLVLEGERLGRGLTPARLTKAKALLKESRKAAKKAKG
jgi:hypothetical protein